MQSESEVVARTSSTGERAIEVHVNERPVILVGQRHTGLAIKQAAIAQGLSIQTDFVLSIERGPVIPRSSATTRR
jgi:hypothetical protein